MASAAAGAELGAEVGSLGGPLGAAAGAVIGAVIGIGAGWALSKTLERANTDADTSLGKGETTQPCKRCEECARKTAEIVALRNELKQRYAEMRADTYNLYVTRPVGPMSWMGHVIQYRSKQASLRAKLQALPPGCPAPPDAWFWATNEPPTKPAPRGP